MTDTTSPPLADDTPARLIQAGLKLFGTRGFAGTSTRALAAEARTNVASISYHFGNKDGLHAACLQAIAQRVSSIAGQNVDPATLTPEQARVHLHRMLQDMTDFLIAQPQAAGFAAFIMRQLSEPGDNAEQIYEIVFRPRHVEICGLWAAATGQPAESEETRLRVFSLIGQTIYFRIAFPLVQRRMDWPAPGPEEARAISDVLRDNIDALIERSRT